MFAAPVARSKTKATEGPAKKAEARHTQTQMGEAAGGVSWDFSQIALDVPQQRGSREVSVLPRVASARRQPSSMASALAEPGHSLDERSLASFQSSFGYNLAGVRLHTGERAARSAASVSAKAYAMGDHIVFGQGQYAPGTGAGQRLLGHELAHVIQQSRGGWGGSGAETKGHEAAAGRAGDVAARGYPVTVAGSAPVGMARTSMFDQFSGGHYSWPFLKLAITNTRPVATIVQDVNALPSAERDQAIKDLTEERTKQGRKEAELVAKFRAQKDTKLQDVIRPVAQSVHATLVREDEVLDGLFGTIAASETAASLRSGTVAPAAAQKPAIDSALKPDLRLTSSGTAAIFQENLPGDPLSYTAKLRKAVPLLINDHYQQQVVGRGQAEHSDPTKVHALTELERVGNASARETDKVFGQYKKGPPVTGPVFKAKSRSHPGGNLQDHWQETENEMKGNPAVKLKLARDLVVYFLQTDAPIGLINHLHNADPKFSEAGAGLNDEAKDQSLIVKESTTAAGDVKRLDEIERGWDAEESRGRVDVQLFRPPDKTTGPLAGKDVADRDFLWDMFQTLVHEYIHTLVAPEYETYATRKFGGASNQFNTLIEGVDTLLDEVVWHAVEPHVNDQKLRDDVEGPAYSSLPPIKMKPASRRRYDSYSQALKLVNVVGIRNLYAAYFLGDVKKISG